MCLLCDTDNHMGIGTVLTLLHISETVSYHFMLCESAFSLTLLERCSQSVDLRYCLNYVSNFLLKSSCEASQVLQTFFSNHKSTSVTVSVDHVQELSV